MTAKKLIEVALPIREISTESVRDAQGNVMATYKMLLLSLIKKINELVFVHVQLPHFFH